MSNQNPVFIPGPTNIPDRLRLAMQVQTQDHRAPDFVETFAPVLEDTKKVFGTTSGQIVTFPSSGTGGWEAAVTNTLSPGDKVLVARYGVFSHRWIDLCERHGLDVQIVDCPWGAGAPADKFADILADDTAHDIRAVLVTHNETATGVRSDISAVRQAMDSADHPAMLFVDCVSSLASMRLSLTAGVWTSQCRVRKRGSCWPPVWRSCVSAPRRKRRRKRQNCPARSLILGT